MLHSSWLYIFDLALFYIREEVFGPVAPLLQFRTEEEAIALANDTNAGSALAMIF